MVPFGDGSQNSSLMLAGLPNFSPSFSSFHEIIICFFLFCLEAVVSLLLSRAFDVAKQVAPDKEIPGVLKKTRGKPDTTEVTLSTTILGRPLFHMFRRRLYDVIGSRS